MMRVRCAELWHSSDPLVEAHMASTGDRSVAWEVRVKRVERHRMHESYRMEYVGKDLVPRKEDFRVHEVVRVLVPAEPLRYSTAASAGTGRFIGVAVAALAMIGEGDKIVTLWEKGNVFLHLEPNFVLVEFLEEEK